MPWLAVLLAAMLAIAGCEGDTGPQGAQGEPGPAGPEGPAGADGGSLPDVTEAAQINAGITGVTIASPPVVEFTLTDERGQGLTGLQPGSISFTVTKLEAGTNGNASAWQSYINSVEEPGVGPGTESTIQASRESGSAGDLVDNGDGTYVYTMATDIANVTDPIAVAYDATLTHRVGFEIRGLSPVINPTFTFRPSDGATMGIFSREMINDDSCNACHDQLALHGNGRFTTDYCVTCHNPGSVDANSANTVDFKVMVHKIHRGEFLPTIEGGVGGEIYSIFGFNDSEHIYAENIMGESLGVVFPQDIRNCTNCHDESDTTTPDAGNWISVPTMEACGSCHDNVNFATGENHFQSAPPVTNEQCTTCHGQGEFLAADQVHRLLDQEAAENFQYNVISVTDATSGVAPTVTFSITDPTTVPPTPYNIETNAAFNQPESRVAIDIGWDTVDYYNEGSGSEVPGFRPGSAAQVVSLNPLGGNATDNMDGTYSMLSSVALPADLNGASIGVGMEGHTAVDLENDGTFHEVPVTGTVDYFGTDGAAVVERREVVDIDVCNDCHQSLSLHGGNRTDETQLCVMCHNANATDLRARVEGGVDENTSADGKKEEAIDFKHMIHAIHAGDVVVYGFGGGVHDYSHVEFPGELNNCTNCHDGDTFYPVNQNFVLATTIDTGPLLGDPTDDVNISPTASACWGCHQSEDVTEAATPASAASHMMLNGASFNATQAADGTLTDNDTMGVVIESCEVCHSEGRSNDVAVAHGVD